MTKQQQAIFWYDVETTGFRPEQHGVHQIGIIIEIDNKVVEKANIKMNVLPTKTVTEGAFTFFLTKEEKQDLADKGIKASDKIKSYQSAEDGFKQLKNLLTKYKCTKFFRAGFNNISFDNGFLEQIFRDFNELDLYHELFDSRDLDVYDRYKNLPYSKKENTPNEKLETLANHFGIEIDAHDGLSDIEATRAIYYKVFKPNEEMHDMEYQPEQGYPEDHQQYHEEVTMEEEMKQIDAEILEDHENPEDNIRESLSDIGEIEPTLALTVQTVGSVEIKNNVQDYATHIQKFLDQVHTENMIVDADFSIGADLVKTIKKQREVVKVANMALDNAEVAEIRSMLNAVDSMLQKKQSSFEKAIKDHKAAKKEAFYEEAYKELIDSDKFAIEYNKFHDLLAERVKGKRSQEAMNKEAEELITELNTDITLKTQRYLEVVNLIKETYNFHAEVLTDEDAERKADDLMEESDRAIKSILEGEIEKAKTIRQNALKEEIEAESVAAAKGQAMDLRTPSFVLNVKSRVVVKASCLSEARSILQRDMAKMTCRVDTLDITEE